MQLEHEMAIDLTKSHRVSLDEWRGRPISERVRELLGWIFERQQ
jgi:cardiolipin synthase A/B